MDDPNIRAACQEFHNAHPEFWLLFCKYTFELIDAGHKHGSANAVFERIRWETRINSEHHSGFKVNNNYRAYYARRFNQMYSTSNDFFFTRRVLH